jgi:hypothetical protein
MSRRHFAGFCSNFPRMKTACALLSPDAVVRAAREKGHGAGAFTEKLPLRSTAVGEGPSGAGAHTATLAPTRRTNENNSYV